MSGRAPTTRRAWARGLAAAALALAAASPADAQTARLTVLADSVSAGAPFEVAVAVTHAPGQQVVFPSVAGDPDAGPLRMLGDAEALSLRRLPPAIRGGTRVDSAVVQAVTFSADSARVGPLTVRVDTFQLATGTALVPVRTVLSGPPPHAPAAFGPADAFPSAGPLWIALGLLAAVVVAGAVWAIRSLRRPPSAPALAPYPAAAARLTALADETPATPAEVETHVVAVRDAVRGYLADRLGVPAREATTRELLDRLAADARLPDPAVHAVRQALVPTDLVAFAGVRPAAEVVARLRDAARAAVEAVEAAMRVHDSADSPPTD